MNNKLTVLFDMDGVVIDTESQYDIIWSSIGKMYHPEIPHFEKLIKGTIMPNILDKYFSHLSQEEQLKIRQMVEEFELSMDFYEVKGAVSFIRLLKEEGIKTGLVTSSGIEKVNIIAGKFHFDQLFDVIVTAERITQGKPDPMCYLLAASDLKTDPADCVVFEDSFAGIQAATSAGMKVVGLSTTNNKESLQDKVLKVIPDFIEFTPEQLYRL